MPTLARSRADLSEKINAAGIAACETTAKAIGIAMRLGICVGSNVFKSHQVQQPAGQHKRREGL